MRQRPEINLIKRKTQQRYHQNNQELNTGYAENYQPRREIITNYA
jgi:hypothetical protein